MLNKSEDFFSKIREFDHTLGVYLTYLLDNEVIQKIRENSSGRTVILHDFRHGIDLKDNLKSRILCIPSMPKLSNDTNCFHAKAALLKGRDRARLVIGSMNLVKEAFSAPKEIACSLDLGYESGLYRTVLEFLCQVRCRSSQWTAVLKELDIRPPKLPKKEDSTIRFIWNSHGCSIAEEVASRHAAFYNGQKPILRVVSPFLPKDYDSSFDNFYDQVQVEEFHLYLRAKTPLPPRIKVRSGTRIYSPRKSSSGYFHGKAVMLDYGDRALLYIGSANFTNHGFFWNLGQGANQECGLILTLNRKSQMTQILDWLKKDWADPHSADQWPEEPASPVMKDERAIPYGMAEREAGKTEVQLALFLPKGNPDGIQVEDKPCRFAQDEYGLYVNQTLIKTIKDKLSIYIPDYEKMNVTVFDAGQYEEAKRNDGDSLFGSESSPIESIRECDLKKGIGKDGITISCGKGISVVEPPLLEQFYHNVRRKLQGIQRRRHFSELDHDELVRELEHQQGGTGLYMATHLYRIFKAKKEVRFQETCAERIRGLCQAVAVDPDRYTNFLRRWGK